MASQQIRCVVFDAVGTLIHPEPSVSQVYFDAARKFGNDVSVDEIRVRFRKLMSGRPATLQTDEASEREFWRNAVQFVVGEVSDPSACFEELYRHFALPENWRVSPGTAETLETLARRGVTVCIASNFDERLIEIVNGKAELKEIQHLFVSSVLGWRKPAPEFYAAIAAAVPVAMNEILMVGDDYELDVAASIDVGMNALHLTTEIAGPGTIQTIPEVLHYCGMA
ncbi:HAD-IA family hydrolase [Planctomicrobium sp. SH527]|uniref:HAD-IA family hydrolase n=1 Tax=Planctomicrobium sp. SH527 TaxID=3448123 RepID=UPI003F5C0F4D